MIYIGNRKLVNNSRIGIPLSITRKMGFNDYVTLFIKDNSIYIASSDKQKDGFYAKFESVSRVVIPVPIQKALKLEKGDEVEIYMEEQYIVVKKASNIREIEIVRQLAIISDALDENERREMDILLDKLKDEENLRLNR